MACLGSRGKCWLGWIGGMALAGCGDEQGSDDATASTQTQSASESNSESEGDADASGSDASATQSSTSPTEGDSSGSSGAETDPDTTDASDDSTTGEPQLCGLEDLEGGAWFELSHAGAPLVAGGSLAMECGGQGALMFLIGTTQGGWTPFEDSIYYSVTIDVDGVVGPTGHFFENPNYGMYVGCDEVDGGFIPNGIAVFPPDGVDIHTLDGLSATVHIELLAGDNPTWDGEIVLEVPDDGSLDQCGEFG